jgi:hypothetical protein
MAAAQDAQLGVAFLGKDQVKAEAAGTGEQGSAEDKRVTTRFMTKYERARILGTRALQIRCVCVSHLRALRFCRPALHPSMEVPVGRRLVFHTHVRVR